MASKDCPGCKFSPGDFKQRIIIQSQSEVQDDTGAMTTVWSTLYTIWCKIVPVHGNEALISQRIDALDIYNITARYIPGVSEKHRILYAARIFQIKSLINVEELSEFMSIKAIDTGIGT
jgi:SPP1 family predicted phage head-tail adaptor